MRILAAIFTGIFCLGYSVGAWASDACSNVAVRASADVSVSDGTSFLTEAMYQAADQSAIRHFYPDHGKQVVAVEGPLAWTETPSGYAGGSDFHKAFALGHQYHAILLYPETVLTGLRDSPAVEFQGESRAATSGDYPYGGTVHIVRGPSDLQAAGFVFDFGPESRIEVALSDWRAMGDVDLPFRAIIDDGQRTFDYRYTSIDIEPASPLWLYETLPVPDLDAVAIHRLHRTLMAAHCLSDAAMIGDRSTPTVISASRGELLVTSNADLRNRFASLFANLDYRVYEDLVEPVVEVSVSGDLGWVAVNVRAAGVVRASGVAFDNQWAWIMTAKKTDGVWLHTGNASNVLP